MRRTATSANYTAQLARVASHPREGPLNALVARQVRGVVLSRRYEIVRHDPCMDARRAVAKGYLPKELPPVFSSATFAHAAIGLTQARPTGASGATKFSLARAGGLRRPAALPNPFAHLELVDLCAHNWGNCGRSLLGARFHQAVHTRPDVGISVPCASREAMTASSVCA